MPTAPLPALLVPTDLMASPSAGGVVAVHSGGASFETRSLVAADLPTHDLVSKHSASGLTSGHLLRATGATSFAFGALTIGDPMSGGAANQILYQGAGGVLTSSSSFVFDYTNSRLGIGVSAPAFVVHAAGGSGWMVVSDSETANTSRAIRFGVRPYDLSQVPVVVAFANPTQTTGLVAIGGGTSAGQAATQVSIYTASSVNTTTGTERARFTGSNGNFWAGSSTGLVYDHANTRLGVGVSPSYGLHVVSSSGYLITGDTEADATTKQGRWGTRPYTTSQTPFIWFYGAAGSASNQLNIGGGTGSGQAATDIWFYTASAVNTTTGTVRGRIDGSGDWTLARDGGRVFIGGSTTPTATLDLLASSTTRAPLRIRAGTAPTSPNDGDIWFDGSDLKLRAGGVTYTLTKT